MISDQKIRATLLKYVDGKDIPPSGSPAWLGMVGRVEMCIAGDHDWSEPYELLGEFLVVTCECGEHRDVVK